jgi:hypothetical protein
MKTPEQTMRESFESHYHQKHLKRDENGDYIGGNMQAAWVSYQRGYKAAENKDVIHVRYSK